MSRIGKLPITIPNGVTVDVKGIHVKVKGSKGELEFTFHPRANIQLDGSTLKVVRTSEEKIDKSLHGVTRTLLSNMVEGVSKGYSKQLEIQGVGYRAGSAGIQNSHSSLDSLILSNSTHQKVFKSQSIQKRKTSSL